MNTIIYIDLIYGYYWNIYLYVFTFKKFYFISLILKWNKVKEAELLIKTAKVSFIIGKAINNFYFVSFSKKLI